MLLATILLLSPLPQSGDALKTVEEKPAVISLDVNDSGASKTLPSAPEAKIKTDSEISNSASGAGASAVSSTSVEAVAPGNPPVVSSAKPAFNRDYDTVRQKKEWYALMAVSSGAAVFDAWSTRRAISGGYGTEANPFLRPFSHSNAMYVATQVSPLVMDFLGRKMMTSRHNWMRRLWWVPQMAGTDMSVSAGIHNVSIVH